jgi:stage III sporulation protein AE
MLTTLLEQQSAGPLQALWMLVGVVLVSALLGGIGDVGGSVALRTTYQSAAVLGAAGVLLTPLFALLDTVEQTVERVTVFLTAYAPVYAAVMAVGGRGAGALSYQTTLLAAIQLLTWLIRGVVYPVLTVSLAFGCTGAVANGFSLDRLSGALHKTVLWALGLFSTLFSGLLSVQQMVAAAGDSVGVRVARFTLSGFVPVVGGLLSEAYTTVMGCAGLLHTVIGAFGTVAVVLILAPPLASCICWSLSLHLAAAAAGLFGLSPIEKLCTVSAGAVRVLIALLAVFGLLMVLATAAVSSAAGR